MKLRELATYQNRLDRPKTCSTVVRSFLLPKSSERTEGFEETQFPPCQRVAGRHFKMTTACKHVELQKYKTARQKSTDGSLRGLSRLELQMYASDESLILVTLSPSLHTSPAAQFSICQEENINQTENSFKETTTELEARKDKHD